MLPHRISGIVRLAGAGGFLPNSVRNVEQKNRKLRQVGTARLVDGKELSLSSARIAVPRNRKCLLRGSVLNADIKILLLNSVLNAGTSGRVDYAD